MTKKHFKEAARLVREAVNLDTQQRNLLAAYYVRLFQTFNARFDRERFYAACGLDY